MCDGFGIVVTKDGRYLFCEPNEGGDCSHSEILHRAGILENNKQFARAFVRVQFWDWKPESFEFDETSTLPGWVDEDEVRERSVKLLNRVSPAWAEYEKVCDTAWAEYEKVCDTARAEYKKVCAPAWAEYEKVCDTARAEYKKVCAPALNDVITSFSSITGYVGKREE